MKGILLNEEEMEKLAGIEEFYKKHPYPSDTTWDSANTFDFARSKGYKILELTIDEGVYFFFKED